MAFTIFLGAFLLFAIQPIIGKWLLPWYGGGPSVWTVLMLFFQTSLLGGYGYAHLLAGTKRRWMRRWVHGGLLGMAAAVSPWGLGAAGGVMGDPTGSILAILLKQIGLSYLLLAASSPLLQRWYRGREPYRLYSLSNAGSLLALAAYPFLIEVWLPIEVQYLAWRILFVLYAACGIRMAWHADPISEAADETEAIGTVRLGLWLVQSSIGSVLLLAVTQQLCQEVAVIPFLWALPLAIYLGSFIWCFSSDEAYHREIWLRVLALAVPAACGVTAAGFSVPLWGQVLAYGAVLLAGCMCCHGELARSKPGKAGLTLFYLVLAAGGALGGVLVGLVAPRVLPDFYEFPFALSAACVVALLAMRKDGKLWTKGVAIGLALAAGTPWLLLDSGGEGERHASERNFYGVLRVTGRQDGNGLKRVLTHGKIMHGFQYLDADKRRWPTTYYGELSAVGMEVRKAQRGPAGIRVGIVGLGTGTLAAYGRKQDIFLYYEINSAVIRIAREQFGFLRESEAQIEIVEGDARVKLQSDTGRRFDLLVVDAFSSDAIPTHLLTVEAGRLYRERLKPDGRLLLHISNRSLNLAPVARAIAVDLGWTMAVVTNDGDTAKGTSAATWVVLVAPEAGRRMEPGKGEKIVRWSDSYSSLWPVLR